MVAETLRFFIYRCFGFMTDPSFETKEIIIILFVLAVVYLCLQLFKYILAFNVILTANKNVHSKMVKGILRSPQQFFDQNPSGFFEIIFRKHFK